MHDLIVGVIFGLSEEECEELELTMGAHHDWGLAPSSYGYEPSARSTEPPHYSSFPEPPHYSLFPMWLLERNALIVVCATVANRYSGL